MRFMMIVIPKGYESAAPDATPSAEAVAKMMKFNQELQKAGVLLALDGLLPPSTGARFCGSERGDRWLLDPPGSVTRGGHRVGETGTYGRQRAD
jgi:hypothetical protein